jgi:iron complex transport system substrate-binding protein
VLDSVRAASSTGPKLRVVYVLGGAPPWVAGPGTYLDELIRLAGGVNVFSDLGSLYAAVSPEEFIARDIDVVLLSEGAAFDRDLAHGARILDVGSWVEVPGPAVTDAARTIARLLRSGAS